jgi:GT2 family glycosyltransferase
MEQEPTTDTEVGWLSGASLMLRRAALGDRIFDERYFMYGEDIHLCQSLRLAGWKVVYTPRVEIVHHGGRSTDSNTSEVQLNRISNLRKVFSIGRNGASLLCFDAVLSVGFLFRALGFGFAAMVRPGLGYDVRAEKSRRFLSASIRSILNGS